MRVVSVYVWECALCPRLFWTVISHSVSRLSTSFLSLHLVIYYTRSDQYVTWTDMKSEQINVFTQECTCMGQACLPWSVALKLTSRHCVCVLMCVCVCVKGHNYCHHLDSSVVEVDPRKSPVGVWNSSCCIKCVCLFLQIHNNIDTSLISFT